MDFLAANATAHKVTITAVGNTTKRAALLNSGVELEESKMMSNAVDPASSRSQLKRTLTELLDI